MKSQKNKKSKIWEESEIIKILEEHRGFWNTELIDMIIKKIKRGDEK